MSDEFFLVLYFFLVIGSQFSGAEEQCKYKNGDIYQCSNVIDVFPSIFYGKYQLKCIDCDIKTFSTFPHENQLVSFNVSNSRVRYLGPRAFSALTYAQNIDLRSNEIFNISRGAFYGLTQLRELNLQNNLIVNLNPGFLDATQVEQVNLSSNAIVELPADAFFGSVLLMFLDLQQNQINKIDQNAFGGLDALEYLDLQRNNLCHIPLGVFRELPTLRVLNLAHNKFTKLAIGTFSGLKNLDMLNLSHNKLGVFDSSILLPFLHLSNLDISSNGIYYVDANDIFQNAPSIRYLSVDDNLFSCTLLQNFLRFFKSKGVEFVNTVGRYDIQNFNGIACIQDSVTEAISFEYFLQRAKADSNLLVAYC